MIKNNRKILKIHKYFEPSTNAWIEQTKKEYYYKSGTINKAIGLGSKCKFIISQILQKIGLPYPWLNTVQKSKS